MEESDERGGEESPPTPFWASSNSPHPSSSSNLLLNPWFIFIIAPIISLFLLIAIPHFFSFLPRIVLLKHPNSVKKTWDTLNLLLVAFAIICGILCRSNGGHNSSSSSITNAEDGEYKTLEKSESSSGEDRQIPRWLDQYGNDPRPLFNQVEPPPPPPPPVISSADSDSTRAATFGRLRSSSSYPDLRKQEAWASDEVDAISSRRQSDHRRRRRRSYGEKDLEDSGLKTVPVDTFTQRHPQISTHSPSASRPAEKARWEFRTLPQKEEKLYSKADEIKKRRHAQPPPPPPPPPSPSQRSEQEGSGGKRSSRGAKDVKNALSFLYQQTKKKRRENRRSFDASCIPSSILASNPIPQSTPPPPPPPPPASVFHHIFLPKKRSGSNSRRIHSIPVPPPPPPPPPPKKLTNTRRDPIPVKDEDYGGSRSPLIPMPPPPPPPFKMQALRFAVRGDFVRVQSGLSDSSEASDVIEIPSNEANANANSNAAVFCPSPDVNTKADSFIASFRAGLKLEKMNSLREKEKTAEADSAPADQEQQPSN